jgi:Family of unknown function (DUF6600)/FecR protein
MKLWDKFRSASCAWVAAVLLLYPAPVGAQDASADPPAHISVVDGTVSLEREGRPETAPASMPLLAGDRLRTENGRVEVMFGDGSALHLDTYSTVDFQSDEVIRLMEGRVRLTIPGPPRRVSYRIDAASGWAQIQEPGEYRVAVTRSSRESQTGDVELVVLRGSAELMNEDGQTMLRAGERAFARAGAAPSYAYVYNSAGWDAFDRWSDARRADRAGISAQYLPETVRSYSSTFDRYGSWQHDTSYGYVWYPRVSVGWRPYFYGRWASFPSFGWTWIGTDLWSWPTHHYGRWGFSAGAWFWIPGRTWGPAWVSWAYAPGYVSWCPLGWDNRAVFPFGRAGYYGGRYDSWHAWTVVPHQRFGYGYVNTTFVGGTRIDARTRGSFVVRQTAPEFRGTAVPRNRAPIYAAGTRHPGGGAVGDGRFAGQGPADSRSRAAVRGAPDAPRATPAPGAVRSGAADDAAAVFRSRRPSSGSGGVGYPPAARAPREAADVIDRMGAPRERGSSRSADVADVPVHRGAVPRLSEDAQPGRASGGSGDDRRLEVPGYRRAPAPALSSPGGDAPALRSGSVPTQRSPYERTGDDGGPAVYRGGRVAPERQVPESRPSDGYRAAPRQAPETSQPPASRSYGGVIEHRGTPPAAAPAREPGPPPSAGPPRGEARPRGEAPSRADPPSRGDSPSRGDAGRSRPSGGQGQSDRGGAVRRGGGRG